MARSFNLMQDEVGRAAEALDDAREGIARTEAKLERNLAQQTAVARLGRLALEGEGLRELLQETVRMGRTVLGADRAPRSPRRRTPIRGGGLQRHRRPQRADRPPAGGLR